jgi:SSS family solute:Na+ symporter
MSTLSSLVLTSSSTLTLDFIIGKKKDTSDKKQITIMRLFIVFFIAISAIIAIIKDAHPGFTFIAQMMGVSWGALAGAFLAPFLYGLYWKKTTRASVWISFVWGVGVETFQLIYTLTGMSFSNSVLNYLFASSVRSGAMTMIIGLIIVPVISLITPKLKKEDVDPCFVGFDEKVEVSAKRSLGD